MICYELETPSNKRIANITVVQERASARTAQSLGANSRLVFFKRALLPKYACFDISAE